MLLYPTVLYDFPVVIGVSSELVFRSYRCVGNWGFGLLSVDGAGKQTRIEEVLLWINLSGVECCNFDYV